MATGSADSGPSSSIQQANSAYAYNIYLSAYDHGIGTRDSMRPFTVGRLRKLANNHERIQAVLQAPRDRLPPTLPTDAEFDFESHDGSVVRVLWVGMRPSCVATRAYSHDGKSHAPHGDQDTLELTRKKGSSLKSLQSCKIHHTDAAATRV